MPAVEKVCEGFLALEAYPSPKFQAHVVGLFIDVSVKVTMSGIVPDAELESNDATGVLITAGADIESI